jgi:hypothetical protein
LCEERAVKERCILLLTEIHDFEVLGCACGHGNNPQSIFVDFFKGIRYIAAVLELLLFY